MTKEERLYQLKCIEKDIYVSSLESTFADESKSCAIHSIIEELEQEPTAKNDLGVDCISRKSVIAIIQNHWWNCRDIDKLVNALPSVTLQETRWIPVSKRLPKAGEYEGNITKYYLVQNEYGDMLVARYTHSEYWEQMYQYKPISDEIVAWMPLPEPYKEENVE